MTNEIEKIPIDARLLSDAIIELNISRRNVAVLTMFQAEALGIKDNLLRDIGIAALLHDDGRKRCAFLNEE